MTHDGDQKVKHLLSAFLHEEKLVIAQKEVGDKTNEIPKLRNLLRPLEIKESNVTTDAMHTQVETAVFLVREKEADFTMMVKESLTSLKAFANSLSAEKEVPCG